MNLTKEVEDQILKELQSRNLPATLLDGIKDKMAKSQIGYQLAIQEYIDSTTKKPQRFTQKTTSNSEFKQSDSSSFQNRINNTKELVKQQVLRELIEAEQEAYQQYFSGNFDTSVFSSLGEIGDHSLMLNLPMAG
ncbi:MAG TPA: hypothetical protein V6C58_21170 [Allocoleopsis sp.]